MTKFTTNSIINTRYVLYVQIRLNALAKHQGAFAVRRLFVLFAFLLVTAASYAVPSSADVANAVSQNDWPRAEALLKEVLQERDSAKAHYQLGQVYAHQFRHADALTEFLAAQKIDPTLKFASSEKLFKSLLEKERAIVDGDITDPAKPSNLPAAEPKLSDEIKLPQPSVPAATILTTVAKLPVSEGSATWWLITGFAVFLGPLALFFAMKKRDDKRVAQEQKKVVAKAKEQLNEILPLSSQLRDAELECKTASYDSVKKDAVLEKLGVVRADLLSAITTTKGGVPIDASKLQSLKSQSADALKAVSTGEWPVTQAPKAGETTPYSPFGESRTIESSRGAESGSGYSHYERPAATPLPQTVVVREGSNDGLLTGLLLGSMLSNNSHASESRHRDDSSNRRHDDSYSSRRDDDDSRPSTPSFDFGSSSLSDSSSSSSSSSFDSGSGNDWQ
ncbi:tetratricopeptide repeat protein [Cupriavidus sp. TMH.W2]|uniref:tetratricopeptide repeat protein n=1 Tax=Cupriavidus sp. TMH.W2 TaxID=3434465 RepID=UPI003D7854A8